MGLLGCCCLKFCGGKKDEDEDDDEEEENEDGKGGYNPDHCIKTRRMDDWFTVLNMYTEIIPYCIIFVITV